MKKLIPLCIAALLLWGCSASSPSVTAANSSDSSPVAGQKVLFQVVSVSDNPPMTYAWSCDIGDLEPAVDDLGNIIGYYEYWTAPEDYSGPATVTCTVTDDRDETKTHVFNIEVRERALERFPLESSTPYSVLSIEKQRDATIAGVWVSTDTGEIRYITSAADQLSTWTGTFGTMHVGYDDNTNYTLWGAPAQGNTITAETSNTTAQITLSEIGLTDSIKDMILHTNIVGQGTSLLVGTNVSGKGVYAYNLSLQQWDDIISDETYQFFSGNSYTYAATSAGIYRISELEAVELLYSGDSCAVLEADDKTTTDVIETDVWHVTKDGGGVWRLFKNGVQFPTQPAEVAGTLDVDLKGRIWCGKYYWNGTAWNTPSDPNSDLVGETIKTVVASTEGRIYLLTGSGTLFRW